MANNNICCGTLPKYEYQEKIGKAWETTYICTDSGLVWERLANCMMYRFLWNSDYAKRITEKSNGVTREITVYDATQGTRIVFTLKA